MSQKAIKESTKARNTGYLPSLDGWRAMAISGVMLTHELPLTIAGHSNARLQGSRLGVALFFAISGVLITTRILEEERLWGYFDLRRFYVRRLFRIQPAAMAYIAAIGLLMLFHAVHDHWKFWIAAMFMAENFVWTPAFVRYSFFEGHYWSLAVEEHFYILLSLLLFFVKRVRLLTLFAAWTLMFLVTKYATSHKLFDPVMTGRRTYWQLDYLIFAAMAAIVLQRPAMSAWASKYWRPWVAFTVTAVVVVLHRWSVHVRQPGVQAYALDGWIDELGLISQIFFTLWIVATMLHPKSWATWFL